MRSLIYFLISTTLFLNSCNSESDETICAFIEHTGPIYTMDELERSGYILLSINDRHYSYSLDEITYHHFIPCFVPAPGCRNILNVVLKEQLFEFSINSPEDKSVIDSLINESLSFASEGFQQSSATKIPYLNLLLFNSCGKQYNPIDSMSYFRIEEIEVITEIQDQREDKSYTQTLYWIKGEFEAYYELKRNEPVLVPGSFKVPFIIIKENEE